MMPSEVINLDESVDYKSPFKTKGEILRGVILHEYGHKIDKLIFDYFNSNNLKKGNIPYDHNALEDGFRLSQDVHPFYRVFAEMKGMSLVRGSGSWIGQKGELLTGKKYEILDERFNEYITDNIDEYLAELFAISRLKPEMLTDKERSFFDRLHKGLMLKGEGFLADIARNPEILLHDKS